MTRAPAAADSVAWTRRTLAFALTALLAASSTATADHPVGPAFGKNRFKARIETGPQGTDTDDYTAYLARGEHLTVKVTSPFQSPLYPDVQLLDPNRVDRAPEAGIGEGPVQKRVAIKSFEIDETGLWAVRIGGRLATEGAYTVSFSVRSPRRTKERGRPLADGDAIDEVTVEAIAGSTLDLDVSWKKRAPRVELLDVLGPGGERVLGSAGEPAPAAARVGKRSLRLSRFPLLTESGTYTIRLGAPDGATTYTLATRVRPPKRPTGTRKITAREPHIVRPALDPIEGVEGMRIRISGWYFSTGAAPTVLFGETPGLEPLVDPSGAFVDVDVPPGEPDAVVNMFVINPDGQGSAADGLFHYVPEPSITGITDILGAPVAGGSTEGGDRVLLQGTYFRAGQLVTFGGPPEVLPLVRDGQIEVRVPARPAGITRVRITDRFGHDVESPFEYEFKARPTLSGDAFIPPVAPAMGGLQLLVRGAGFEATDTLLLDGTVVASAFVTNELHRFTPDAGADRDVTFEIVDRFGLRSDPVTLRIKAPGVIDSVAATAGPRIGATDVSIHGGTLIRIAGSRFDAHDTVSIGGTSLQPDAASRTSLDVATVARAAGLVDVVVTDAVGQATTASSALRFVGFADRTSARAPAASATDDRSALRGAAADLDGDGDADDVVLVSHGSSPGTRAERTRVFLGGTGSSLADVTATDLPAAGDDVSGLDDWRALAVALGDLDGVDGPDIVIVGDSPDATRYGDVRIFLNDGAASFALDEDDAPGTPHTAAVFAVDENDVQHEVQSARSRRGRASAVVLADLDGDGDLDVVVGRSSFESVDLGVDPAVVDFTVAPAAVTSTAAAANDRDRLAYESATRVFENRIADGDGLVDVTADALPPVGDSSLTPVPGFHARDVAAGDIDDDGDVDLVVVWDDPTTVTPKGLIDGSGSESPLVATRVLVNDGTGAFTDATGSWLPSPSAPEYLQASRVLLRDLDGDDLPELILLHADGLDAYQGPPGHLRRALRILTNGGATSGFSDVSDTALPALDTSTDDNFRGTCLLLTDVDGDGADDILIGTDVAPGVRGETTRLPALRLLRGATSGIAFSVATDFLPSRTADSGETDGLVLVPDLAPAGRPCVLLLSEARPTNSPSGAYLRAIDWER